MIGRASAIARVLVAVFIVIAYALLAHRFSTTATVGIALLPVALAPLLIAAMLRIRKWTLLLCALVVAMVFWLPSMREFLTHNLAWIYFAQDSALNLTLGYLFGRTLLPGCVPLCSRIATVLQDNPSPRLLQYTRRVTVAWTIFFAAMVSISALLFFAADRTLWSEFANLLYWPLLLSMFALEYLTRMFALPRAERAGIFATVRAFRTLAATQFAAEARA